MSEGIFDYQIRSELPAHPESPASLGNKFLNTLDALSRIEPTIFANWEVMNYGEGSALPLAAARPRIASIVESNVYRDDWRRPQPQWGYAAGTFTTTDTESRTVSVRIHAGGNNEGDTWLEVGGYKAPPDLAIVTYPVFKAALLAINASWPPPWACVQAFKWTTAKRR
jgi:hypothetical protein